MRRLQSVSTITYPPLLFSVAGEFRQRGKESCSALYDKPKHGIWKNITDDDDERVRVSDSQLSRSLGTDSKALATRWTSRCGA